LEVIHHLFAAFEFSSEEKAAEEESVLFFTELSKLVNVREAVQVEASLFDVELPQPLVFLLVTTLFQPDDPEPNTEALFDDELPQPGVPLDLVVPVDLVVALFDAELPKTGVPVDLLVASSLRY